MAFVAPTYVKKCSREKFIKSKEICWLSKKNLLNLLHLASHRVLLKIQMMFYERNTIPESSNKTWKTVSITEHNNIAY